MFLYLPANPRMSLVSSDCNEAFLPMAAKKEELKHGNFTQEQDFSCRNGSSTCIEQLVNLATS